MTQPRSPHRWQQTDQTPREADAMDVLLDAIADRVADRLSQPQAPAPELAAVESSRLALTKAEAAEALGCSVDHFERHIAPDLRIIRSGRLRLVPRTELERWIERNAARVLEAAA